MQIVKYDGFGSLYHGYKATLLRDVPFSALQFAFYGKGSWASFPFFVTPEKFKQLALVHWVTPGDPLTLGAELACGSFAGGIAGAMTTPLDVVKTLLQTQQKRKKSSSSKHSSIPSSAASSKPIMTSPSPTQPPTQTKYYTGILDGLLWNYRHQGLGGLFRGIGPRVFWTSLQSAAMFVIYEQVLRVQDEARTSGTWPYGGERGRPWWSARDVAEAIEGREGKGDGRGWRGGVL
ncbi:mitochondrial carrier domain-containing protein [Jimgerdemannia flammicorona]|uniref:Mitochondrial carrier domain-containing protein n=1 Tax=Jimgerdemannia flammicorona TaxID=994334 RepID=A0A433PUE2_9FUNG|nr:mitochondrial carrier domain-containing protein [Jimgerdemannia flammicorona]